MDIEPLSLCISHYRAFYNVIINAKLKLLLFKEEYENKYRRFIDKQKLIDLILKNHVKELFSFLTSIKNLHMNFTKLGLFMDQNFKDFKLNLTEISTIRIFQIIFIVEIFCDGFILEAIKNTKKIPYSKSAKDELFNYIKGEFDFVMKGKGNDYLVLETLLNSSVPVGFPFNTNSVNEKLEKFRQLEEYDLEYITTVEVKCKDIANNCNSSVAHNSSTGLEEVLTKNQKKKNRKKRRADKDTQFEYSDGHCEYDYSKQDCGVIEDNVLEQNKQFNLQDLTSSELKASDPMQIEQHLPKLLKSSSDNTAMNSFYHIGKTIESIDANAKEKSTKKTLCNISGITNDKQNYAENWAENTSKNKSSQTQQDKPSWSNLDEVLEYVNSDDKTVPKHKKKGQANVNARVGIDKSKSKKKQFDNEISISLSSTSHTKSNKEDLNYDPASKFEDDREVELFIERLRGDSIHAENIMKVYPFVVFG